MAVPSILPFAQSLVRDATTEGDWAIDATVGNGHDTLTLAHAVGASGHVVGFDVQEAALGATRERLQQAGVLDRVDLVHAGHETMAAHVPEAWEGGVSAVMFNLGYLPGSDKTRITRPETTCQALAAAVPLVRPGGVITVVLYTGHAGGRKEADAVHAWAAGLDARRWGVLSYRFMNQPNDPPHLLACERRAE